MPVNHSRPRCRRPRRPWTLGEHFMLTVCVAVLGVLVVMIVAYLAGA